MRNRIPCLLLKCTHYYLAWVSTYNTKLAPITDGDSGCFDVILLWSTYNVQYVIMFIVSLNISK